MRNRFPKPKMFRKFFFQRQKIEKFLVSEIGFSSFSADLGGARLFLTSKSDSWRYFASDGQIFMSVGPKIIEIGPILAIFKLFEILEDFGQKHEKNPHATFERISPIVPGFVRIWLQFAQFPGRSAKFAQKWHVDFWAYFDVRNFLFRPKIPKCWLENLAFLEPGFWRLFEMILKDFGRPKSMIFACVAWFFLKQTSTADRTRKIVPIMAARRGGG